MIRIYSIAVVSLAMCGCGGNVDDDAPAPPPAANAVYTVADFQTLRYLEGNWRGSGYAGGPFYETYRFVNDSTIEMTAWTDSTMTAAREKSDYMLRDGVIRTSSGARLIRVDEEGHHFQGASNAWTFRQVTADRWTARVGPSTTYTMDRVAGPG